MWTIKSVSGYDSNMGAIRQMFPLERVVNLILVSDTSPKANARYFELLRQAGPEKRLAIDTFGPHVGNFALLTFS